MTDRKAMRVLLGMSGGIDSTYAARLLLDEGFEVEGAVLKMHKYTETSEAELAARELGIPIHIIDCTEAFEREVVESFVDEYTAARTPNPCIICNRAVKFHFLCEFAKEHGFDKIATGHYARVVRVEDCGEERYAVARAADPSKDQTYMLWRLSQEQLKMIIFPLSELTKNDVRALARTEGLSAADKGDSQEICFISPDDGYASFVERKRGVSPSGDFVDASGRVLGRHKGIIRYTVGQRKGLGVSLGERAFVTDIDPIRNTVTLSTSPKMSRTVHISGMVFSGIKEPEFGKERTAFVKLRYQARQTEARVVFHSEGRATLHLSKPQPSVTAGQSAVIYDGETVIAGGFIDSVS